MLSPVSQVDVVSFRALASQTRSITLAAAWGAKGSGDQRERVDER